MILVLGAGYCRASSVEAVVATERIDELDFAIAERGLFAEGGGIGWLEFEFARCARAVGMRRVAMFD